MALVLSKKKCTWCLEKSHCHEEAFSSIKVEHNNYSLQYTLLQQLITTLNFASCSSMTPDFFQGRNIFLMCFFYHQHTRPNQRLSIRLCSYLSLLSTTSYSRMRLKTSTYPNTKGYVRQTCSEI